MYFKKIGLKNLNYISTSENENFLRKD